MQAREVKYQEFHSWDSFLHHVSSPPRFHLRQSLESRRSFTEVNSYDEAMSLARNGWEEGTQQTRKYSDVIFNSLSHLIEQQNLVTDVEGGMYDIGRVLQGEPECWVHNENSIVDGPGTKILKLVFNGSVSCGVDASVIIAKGAAITALVDLLELTNHRVELVYVQPSKTSWDAKSTVYDTSVLIKKADQPLDLPRVAYACAHPSMLRCLGFRTIELYDEADQKAIGYGYGSPCASHLEATADISVGYSMYGDVQWNNPETAVKWVEDRLREQGLVTSDSDHAYMPTPILPTPATPVTRPIVTDYRKRPTTPAVKGKRRSKADLEV